MASKGFFPRTIYAWGPRGFARGTSMHAWHIMRLISMRGRCADAIIVGMGMPQKWRPSRRWRLCITMFVCVYAYLCSDAPIHVRIRFHAQVQSKMTRSAFISLYTTLLKQYFITYVKIHLSVSRPSVAVTIRSASSTLSSPCSRMSAL